MYASSHLLSDLEGVSESSCIGPFSFYDLSFFTILLPLIFLIFLTMCWALNLLWSVLYPLFVSTHAMLVGLCDPILSVRGTYSTTHPDHLSLHDAAEMSIWLQNLM